MKGLVGGIPLALLVAAVANGQAVGKRHAGGPGTVIGGPSGEDGGNSAGIGFDSTYSSTVNEAYKDDHSFDLKNHVVTPPYPAMPGFRKRGDRGGVAIGGPSGNDGGNSADIEFDSDYSSAVNEAYKDDHSFDLENHIVTPPVPPIAGFRKRGDRGGTAIGGPSGNDGGNSADVDFKSLYSSAVSESYEDDHSWDIDNKIITPPAPPMPGFRKRGHGGGTAIGGPSGADEGNSAGIGLNSKYSSTVTESYKDDHSVDIKNHIVTPPPPPFGHPGFRKRGGRGGIAIGGPSGDDGGNSADIKFDNDYLSEINESYKDDHSFDLDNKIITPPAIPGFRKRGGRGGVAIGGPSGDDGGNSADIKFDNDYLSEVNESYKDDHSFDLDNKIITPPAIPGFRRRGDGGNSVGPSHKGEGEEKEEKDDTPGAIRGPVGDDGGSSADLDFDDTYTSRIDESYEDNHSFDLKNHVVTPPHRPMMPFVKRVGPTAIGGPSGNDEGNSANIEFDSDYSSVINEDYKDDHSFSSDNTIVTPPVVHPPPLPHGPGFGGSPGGPPAPGLGGGPGGFPAVPHPSAPAQPHAPGFGGSPGGFPELGHPSVPSQPQIPGFGGGPGGPPATGSQPPHTPGIGGGPGGPPVAPHPSAPAQPHAPGFGGSPGGFPELGHPPVPSQPQVPGSGGPGGPHEPGHPSNHAPSSSKPCSTATVRETITRVVTDDNHKPTAPAFPHHPPQPSVPSIPGHGLNPSVPSVPNHTSAPVPTAVSPTGEPSVPGHGHHDPGFSKPEAASTPCPTHKSEGSHAAPSHPAHPVHEPGFSKPPAHNTPCPSGCQGSHVVPTAPSYPVHQPTVAAPEGGVPSAPSFSIPTGGYSNPQGSFGSPSSPSYPAHVSVPHSGVHAEPSASHQYASTSTVTVSRPSSFAVVPVHVPSAAASASATTPLLQRPSAADPWSNPDPSVFPHARPSATPSSSPLFTGAAGRLVPAAGVMSAVAGLVAVLAFAL
ncbi:putative GPI anchored protein [Aspergillus clavatus NRRL 1]|uniref:GPI anchored protein, putative n=1 Tax=Aspergillus clavatus (strain ATCC 1007 / CBS 513.65 / DSM 816 / NCTC 3887 / NRRL 1 / QM 1276 / 107) TaxID=344612 RepID=A1CHR1_ASPCL|nr:GPI anchored protein, putative [Aspergillus clavatus NRRL 1]EAW10416.1 GPI anchored protein, putative [Aspergillus clavatus NRRL 1]